MAADLAATQCVNSRYPDRLVQFSLLRWLGSKLR